MKKLYLILLLFCLVAGTVSAKPPKGSHNNMTPCDSPTVNPDSLLLQYLTGRPLSVTGGMPPYTYTFSPTPSLAELISLPDTNITFTITVTGANGCSSIYHAHYVALQNVSTGSCTTPFLSEYIQDTVISTWGGMDNAIELYNPTFSPINLSGYYLVGTTHGSLYATPFFIALHDTIKAHSSFLIANTNADTALTNKAGMLSDSLTFGGKDIVALAQISISVPAMTFSFLDKVGAITPLPADSGWAVGSGSTKNHTLVRQTSTTQGDMNWGTCAGEWNVYPRGTFSYIGTYANVCTPEDAILYLKLANDSVQCGDPSYYNFDVMVQADSNKILYFVAFLLDFPAGISAGTAVTLGPDFPADTGAEYVYSYRESPSSLYIQVSVTDSTFRQTIVGPVPKVLVHVKMKIANACQTGNIEFNPSLLYTDQYIDEDSTFIKHDSAVYDSLVPNYHCPYQCDPYPCNEHCCDPDDTDDYGNCIDSCWDTCYYTCYDTCYDTIKTIHHYDVYSYSHYHIDNYSAIIYNDTAIPLQTCPLVIEPLAPVNAGTNAVSVPANSSILTINGANFGNEKGQIDLPNANQGGAGYVQLDSTDILSWSNSQIVLKMPSVVLSNNSVTPGSGIIQLFSACGGYADKNITINYNIMGSVGPLDKKLRWNMDMGYDSNSIIFRCDTSISNHPRIQADVLQAIQTWNCYTGINWKMGDNITLDSSTQDGVSVIYFSPTPLAGNILMQTIPYINNSCNNLGDSMTYVNEADIAITPIPKAGYSWNYNISDTVFPGNYYYFYDALLHELGHAHLLNHVDDSTSLMYYMFHSYQRKNILSGTYPGPQTLYGGFDVVNTSAANAPSCSYHALIPSSRTCVDPTMAVDPVSQNKYELELYPNPVSNQDLTISYELTQDSYVQFKIIDYTGREIMTLENENKQAGSYKEQINTNGFASGIYLFIANINGSIQTIKFIKL